MRRGRLTKCNRLSKIERNNIANEYRNYLIVMIEMEISRNVNFQTLLNL